MTYWTRISSESTIPEMHARSPLMVRFSASTSARNSNILSTVSWARASAVLTLALPVATWPLRDHTARLTTPSPRSPFAAANSRSQIRADKVSRYDFDRSFRAVNDERSAVNCATHAPTTSSASEFSSAACMHFSERLASAILDHVSAHLLVSIRQRSINVRWPVKLHFVRHIISNLLSMAGNPAWMTRTWMLERIIRRCSSPEEEPDRISPKW